MAMTRKIIFRACKISPFAGFHNDGRSFERGLLPHECRDMDSCRLPRFHGELYGRPLFAIDNDIRKGRDTYKIDPTRGDKPASYGYRLNGLIQSARADNLDFSAP